MMHRPWDCAQPDEWLPRSLRLCWGDSTDGGGGSGGFGDSGGFAGATTGGGDWGSSGSYDASGFNSGFEGPGTFGAGGSEFGFGQGGGGGDWASFGPTSYGGFNAPNPTYGDIAGPNPGVLTGGGDWGSAGVYSAAGMGGGPSGGLYGGGGGGVFGDYGGGGGGGYIGGGGGGGSFGGFSGGGGRASVTDSTPGYVTSVSGGKDVTPSEVSSPYADDTGPAGRGESEVSSPFADDTGPTGRGEQDTVGPAPAPEADFGKPAAAEAAPEAAPSQAVAPSENRSAPSEPEAEPSSFGPQALDQQSLSEQGRGPQGAEPNVDYEGSPYADMGPQAEPGWFESLTQDTTRDDPSTLPSILSNWLSNIQNAPVADRAFVNPITNPWNAPVTTPAVRSPFEAPQWAQNPRSFEVFDPKADTLAQSRIDARSLWDISTYLSQANQTPFNVSAFNAITGALSGFRGDPFDAQARGEQGRAGQQTDLATQLGTQDISPGGIEPGGEQYGVEASPAADLATQLGTEDIGTLQDTTPWGSVFEAPEQAPDWGSVFEGAPSNQNVDWDSVFEGAAPPADVAPTIEAFIPGGRETDFTGYESLPGGAISAFIPGGRETNFEYQSQQPDMETPFMEAIAPAAHPYAETLDTGPPGAPPSPDDATTKGSDPALSGYPADPGALRGEPGGAPAAPGQPAAPPQANENPSILPEQSSAPITLEAIANAIYGVAPDLPGTTPEQTPGTAQPAPPPAQQPSLVDMLQSQQQQQQQTQPGQTQPQPDVRPSDASRPEPLGDQPVSPDPPAPDKTDPPPGPPGINEPQNVRGARDYLIATATPGDTMSRLGQGDIAKGTKEAIDRLHPEFALRLEATIKEARAAGIPASIFSAYRAPAFGVNSRGASGWASKSQHGKGGAVDFTGIGARDSKTARAFYEIARNNGLYNPFGRPGAWRNAKEFNHFQITPQVSTFQFPRGQLGVQPVTAMPSIWSRVNPPGYVPSTQQAAVSPLPGRPGIGSDRSNVPWQTADVQPDVARPRPAEVPVALPPQAPQETRPPVDIPAPAPKGPNEFDIPVTPAVRNATVIANNILKQATAHLNINSDTAALNAAGVVAAKAMAAAGIPANLARSLMLKGAMDGAIANGYGPGGPRSTVMGFSIWGKVQSTITDSVNAAMQGYQPAKPGELQGPPAPAAPGKQGALPSGQQYADLSQEIAPRAEPDYATMVTRGDYGREGDVAGQQPIGSWNFPTLQNLSPLTAPPAPPPTWGQPPAPPPPPQYTPGGPGMFNPFRGNEAALPGLLHLAAGGRDAGQPPAVEPGQLPGRAEWETPLPGGLVPNVDPFAGHGIIVNPNDLGRGRVIDPDIFPLQRQEQDLQQQNLDPRSWQQALLDALQNFNPISTAEAKGRGRDSTLERAIALAREGGNLGGQRGTSVIGNKVFTFYAPGASGLKGMEGPMIGSKGNPLTTLDDVRNGAGFVSLAGHQAQFGQQVFIGDITYTSPLDGKQYTLNNVVGRVDDTGGKFGGRDNPDQNHFDIAVGDFSRGWNDSTAGRFVASNYATAVPGRGIGSDYAADDLGTAVGAQPPAQEAPMRGLAKGGHVAKDEKVVVGEEGPEYFVPDEPGTIFPHQPQPGKTGKSENIDRWPRIPAPNFPGRYGGVEREILRQTREAQYAVPTLMDMIDSGQLRLTPNWHAMLNDPALIALGRSRMDDRRGGVDPGAEQYGAFIPPPAPAAEPPDPNNPMAQALGYGSIRRPLRVGRQSY